MPFPDGLATEFASGRRTELDGDTIVINEAGANGPAFARRGLGSRGKQRTSIEIVSEPLLFDLDEMVLGAKPAEAIRAALTKAVKNITEIASKSTLARRLSAAKSPDSKSARKRYSGGRTGFKAPNQTPRLFNDSERLAEGFFVRENKQDTTWTVNSPANRLDPSTFPDPTAFDRMLNRLRSLVPLLQDSRELLADKGFNAAVSESVRDIITKGEMNGDAAGVAKLKALAAARKKVVLAFVRAVRTVMSG